MKRLKLIFPLLAIAGLTACAGPAINDSFYTDSQPLSVQTTYFYQTANHTYVDPAINTYDYGKSFYPGRYRYLYNPIEGHY